jgi:hypothetical protein
LLELIDDVAAARAEAATVQSVLRDFTALAIFLIDRSGGSVTINYEDLNRFANGTYSLVCEGHDQENDPAGTRKTLRVVHVDQQMVH